MGNLSRCRGPLPSPFRIQKSDFSDRQRARQDNFTSHGLNTSRVFRIFSDVERPTRKLPDFGRRLSRIFAGFPPRPRDVSRKARAGFCRILPLPGKHKPDFLRHLPGNAGFREKSSRTGVARTNCPVSPRALALREHNLASLRFCLQWASSSDLGNCERDCGHWALRGAWDCPKANQTITLFLDCFLERGAYAQPSAWGISHHAVRESACQHA